MKVRKVVETFATNLWLIALANEGPGRVITQEGKELFDTTLEPCLLLRTAWFWVWIVLNTCCNGSSVTEVDCKC